MYASNHSPSSYHTPSVTTGGGSRSRSRLSNTPASTLSGDVGSPLHDRSHHSAYIPAFDQYHGHELTLTTPPAGGLNDGSQPHVHTLKKQKEKSDHARSVLQVMNWRFLTETVLDDREYQPPSVLTKEGLEYVNKLERERLASQAQQTQQTEQVTSPSHFNSRNSSHLGTDGFQTPSPSNKQHQLRSPNQPLHSILSDLVSPSQASTSAYFSPPVPPATIRERLGLFASSPSNKRTAEAQARMRVSHTPTSPSKRANSPPKQFYADTPLRRLQQEAKTTAASRYLQGKYPVNPMLRSISRKELPPLPPPITVEDLNITNERQQRIDGLLEGTRESGHFCDEGIESLEKLITNMTVESIKESHTKILPAPHPILDRSARGAKRLLKQHAELIGVKVKTKSKAPLLVPDHGRRSSTITSPSPAASQVEEKQGDHLYNRDDDEDGEGGIVVEEEATSSSDPEAEDDAKAKIARVKRAREYHARMLAQLTDPFSDEKRMRRELGVAPKMHRDGTGTGAGGLAGLSVGHADENLTTPAQLIVWRESHRLKVASDVPKNIADILLSEPTAEDRQRFMNRIKKAQEKEKGLTIQTDETGGETTEIPTTEEILALGTNSIRSISPEIDPTSPLEQQRPTPLLLPQSSTMDAILTGDAPFISPKAIVSASPTFLARDPSLSPSMHSALSPSISLPSLAALSHLPPSSMSQLVAGEDTHANPFHPDHKPKAQLPMDLADDEVVVDEATMLKDGKAKPPESSLEEELASMATTPSSSTTTKTTRSSVDLTAADKTNLSDISLAPLEPTTKIGMMKLDPILYDDPHARFEKEHEPLETHINDVKTHSTKFHYQDYVEKGPERYNPFTAKKAPVDPNVVTIPISAYAREQLNNSSVGLLHLKKEPPMGIPGFHFSSPLHGSPSSTTMNEDLVDFTSLNQEVAQIAAQAARVFSPEPVQPKSRTHSRFDKVVSPSPSNPQPPFRSPKISTHPVKSSGVVQPKRQIGAWYLPRKLWKVERKATTNEEVQAEEEAEDLIERQKEGGADAMPREIIQKQEELNETIPTLFIASVYKGHLEKMSKQQRAQRENQQRDEKAAMLAPGGGGRPKVRFQPPTTAQPAQTSAALTALMNNLASSNGLIRSLTPPPLEDILQDIPVRIPGYLSSLIPLDPTNPETVIVDFSPGTNKLATPKKAGSRGSSATKLSPSKQRKAAVPSQPLWSDDTPATQPPATPPPPNPNVLAYQAAVAAAASLEPSVMRKTPSKSHLKTSLAIPSSSTDASDFYDLNSPSSVNLTPGSPTKHLTVSEMIQAHQAASIGAMIASPSGDSTTAADLRASPSPTPSERELMTESASHKHKRHISFGARLAPNGRLLPLDFHQQLAKEMTAAAAEDDAAAGDINRTPRESKISFAK